MKSNKNNLATIATLQGTLYELENHYKSLLDSLHKDVADCSSESAHIRLEALLTIARAKQSIKSSTMFLNGDTFRPIYACSSAFLIDCYKKLMVSKSEELLFCTGIEVGSLRVLETQLFMVYKRQTPYYIAADNESNIEVLHNLNNSGQRLLAWLHSHPGKGKEATFPSQIDMEHQRDIEAGKYPAIGLVYSRDGFVHFFSHQSEFEIAIIGKGFEYVDEKTIKLKLI